MNSAGSTSSHAIEVAGLTKSFGFHRVLKGIDLNVSRGESLVIFGPNGAGKTTLIKVLATLSRPSRGKVHLADLDIRKDATQIRRQIGVISHHTFLYDNLSAYENLKFYGKMYGVSDLEERISEVIDRVELRDCLHDRVGVFSRGMQQRLSIARAILHDPRIMLLDEPETGLDQQASAMLTDLLKTLTAEARTVLMTTHNLAFGLALAGRVVILHKGRIVHEGTARDMDVEGLRQRYNQLTGATS